MNEGFRDVRELDVMEESNYNNNDNDNMKYLKWVAFNSLSTNSLQRGPLSK